MNFNNIWYFGRATRWRSYQPSSGGWLEKNQDPSFEGWSKNLPWNMWGLSCGMPGRSLCISKGKNQEKKDSFVKTDLSSVQGSLASQVAPPMQEEQKMQVWSLGWTGGGNDYSLQYSCLENFTEELGRLYSPWGHKESDKTEYVYTRQLLTAWFSENERLLLHSHRSLGMVQMFGKKLENHLKLENVVCEK